MKRESFVIFGLIAITLLAFAGVGRCQFVNLDDPAYILDNPHVMQGLSKANVEWAWETFYQGNYLPLTWLSLMLDVTLFGKGPLGFHLVNLAFHIANAILLYLFFRNATGSVWRSAMVAAIFAVHPLRVESVAWAVERKDVLGGFFGFLAMLAYLRFTRKLNIGWYAVVLLMFAASLLAKQTLSTLPFVLLLLDYWPLGRWDKGPAPIAGNAGVPKFPRDLFGSGAGILACHRAGKNVCPTKTTGGTVIKRCWSQLAIEKLPMILLVIVILRFTLQAQSGNAMADLQRIPMSWRLENVPVSYARYLGKMFWFGNLAVFYPRYIWSTAEIIGSSLLLVAITVLCLAKSRSAPWLTIGWLWFLGVLVPMIGILQFGPQAMADRFTYFAAIGLVVMVIWSIPATIGHAPALATAAAVTVIGILMVFTFRQTLYWMDSEALFKQDIDAVGSNPLAEINLGVTLYDKGKHKHDTAKLTEAIAHLRQAVALADEKANAHAALALALGEVHKFPEAIDQCKLAVQHDQTNPEWKRILADLIRQERQEMSPLPK